MTQPKTFMHSPDGRFLAFLILLLNFSFLPHSFTFISPQFFHSVWFPPLFPLGAILRSSYDSGIP